MASRYRPSNAAARTIAGAALLCAAAHAENAVPTCLAAMEPAAFARPAPNNVRVVTGAPHSALGTSETITLLPDGNRIVRQNTIRQWRDSSGRTRAEYSLSSIGGPTPLELHTTFTVIDDPAARERYMLQPGAKVAVTMAIVPCRIGSPPHEPDIKVGPPRPAHLPRKVSTPLKLGERKLDGETVAGSRIEATIPAGAIGNDQPIRMSAEPWYGKDLQVVVEATYQDPRTGETKYKLSDIDRAEPDAKLFRVPDDYSKLLASPSIRKRR
jgi:hypothetical protein